ncbi:hypothetical protein [Saudi moumouvirus]|uniref:Uncharacterized protein n=1 Tax=Moumouvirus sp. 'Monve' TaxID=1128131 RepID=H2ED00_9VIRU|nr:hypothetical protein mv_L68 [Moumouvirus Monve]AQN68704.1 hypothetical protein [Saudi moumouvirus]
MSFSFEKECYIVTFHGNEDLVYYVGADSEENALEEAVKYEIEVFIGQLIFAGKPCYTDILMLFEKKLRSLPYTIKYSGPQNETNLF